MTQTPYRLIWHWRHLCSHHTDTLHAHTDVIYDQGTLTSLHSHHTDALYAHIIPHIIPAPFIFTSHWRSITLTSHRRALCSRSLTPFTLTVAFYAHVIMATLTLTSHYNALYAHIPLTPFTLISHWRSFHSHHTDTFYAHTTLTPFYAYLTLTPLTLTPPWRPERFHHTDALYA